MLIPDDTLYFASAVFVGLLGCAVCLLCPFDSGRDMSARIPNIHFNQVLRLPYNLPSFST